MGARRRIWGIRGVRSHAISGRGINLLKPLRRHYPATCDGLCREPPEGRDRRGLEPEETMDEGGAGRRVPSLVGMTEEVAARLRQSERLRRDRAHGGLLQACENKYRTHSQFWQDIFCFFSRGRRDAGT